LTGLIEGMGSSPRPEFQHEEDASNTPDEHEATPVSAQTTWHAEWLVRVIVKSAVKVIVNKQLAGHILLTCHPEGLINNSDSPFLILFH
jgi:hypothetical protein